MISHEYSLKQDHTIDHEDYLEQTLAALECHDYWYKRNSEDYFQDIENAKRVTNDGQPYLHFKHSTDSSTDAVIAFVPFANRIIPANTPQEIATYATSDQEKLPEGIKPNSHNQAVKHHLSYTAIAGLPEVKDEQGRSPSLIVISSPSMDYRPNLTPEDNKALRSGDLEPFARTSAKIAEELNLNNLHITGYSFGAAVAARAASVVQKNFDIKSLALGEPTTFKKRSLLRIMGDYTVLDAFNGTSGDKTLEKAPNTDWLQDGPQALRDIDRNGNGGWLENMYGNGNFQTNLRIARALGKSTLLEALKPSRHLPTTLFYASDSLMTKGIETIFSDLENMHAEKSQDWYSRASDDLQLIKVRPLGAVAAKHIVGEIPMLYADYMARSVKHGYTTGR